MRLLVVPIAHPDSEFRVHGVIYRTRSQVPPLTVRGPVVARPRFAETKVLAPLFAKLDFGGYR